MADFPQWPSSLPFPLVDSPGYSPLPNSIRTQMDAGLARVRRRSTAAGQDATLLVQLRPGQVQTLDDFVEITLGDTLPFGWYDFRRPITDQNKAVYRFKQRPTYAPNRSGLYWIATLSLELVSTTAGRYLLDVSDGTTGLTNT